MTLTTHPESTTAPRSPGRRIGRLVVELLPPFVVALIILPFVISFDGSYFPWDPQTIDLQVYVYAVRDLLVGKDIFATTTPGWGLYFIYPPIAAILMIPLAIGPYALWQVLWTLALVAAQQAVLRRCGVPRGWKLALIGIVVVLAVEPIRTTLGYGQVNTLLMALVIMDLLPDRPGERRFLPRGTLIGLAAAIKLTPALFVIFAFLIGKRKLAITGIISFGVLTGIGAIFLWPQTVSFFGGLLAGDTRTASPLYVGNQALSGVFFRLIGDSRGVTLVGLAIGGLIALIGTVVAVQWWRRRQYAFAVGLVGLCTCLASPLSWTHHYVWILPLAVAVALQVRSRPGAARGPVPLVPLPLWTKIIAGAWVVWVCACPPLALLPYGQGKELGYSALQDFVGIVGPVLGAGLIIALAFAEVRRSAARTSGRHEVTGA
ncbi:glycosyltransferase 87 family protein [Microlunatus speluncae]|uniref:glycosyltransferase 87 family protein n=1 Tax=Microlunatus speluncae TaxID=2594267 RepID=UPI0012666B76|nr:glycosyltransferase 87 family protein [Microlunatus speluncae]